MESNKDEALKCLAIAQRHRDSNNYDSARRFCQKSINLFSTPEALKLLDIIEREAASGGGSEGAKTKGSSSATEAHASAGTTKQRPQGTSAGEGSTEKREYTEEQRSIVQRIRACEVAQYYEIMSLKKDCDEADIKKAYRKVRVLFLTRIYGRFG